MNTNIEREREITVKQVRLRDLEQAGIQLASDNMVGAQTYLENFLGTIPRDSSAFAEAVKLRDDIRVNLQNNIAKLRASEPRYLESADINKFGVPSVFREALQEFHNGLWDIANRHRLIPSE